MTLAFGAQAQTGVLKRVANIRLLLIVEQLPEVYLLNVSGNQVLLQDVLKENLIRVY
ncbi:hypothetical protein [Xanthomarina gelatinilytica]|uniref:hypothetical protein n=1 Tax=Xanthomarina gelatinilytica TaxID=1137281 RepID=UPI003AA7B4F8